MTDTTDTTCPTPAKARYATREAAESAARRSQLAIGTLLTPYQCDTECGWWHLTSHPRPPLPPPDLTGVHALDDKAFRRLALADAEKRAPRPRALALRDPSLVHRWIHTIKQLQRDLGQEEQQLNSRRDPDAAAHREAITLLRQSLTERRREASQIIADTPSRIVPGPDAGDKARREAAGELALDRLIAAHRAEFCEYLAEEYERLGIPLPGRIEFHLARHRGEADQAEAS